LALNKPTNNGKSTLRDQLTAMWNMSGEKPEELEIKPIPIEFRYIWDWFIQIKNSGDIDYNQIKSFSELMQIDIQPSEVAMITSFEQTYREVMNG
jgi:hypothetical protein